MDRETQLNILSRINQKFDERSTELSDSDMFHCAANYSDPERAKLERDVVKMSPVIIGHVSELQNEGDFITDNALGIPILVTRSEGKIRAFINVCGHRGANICQEPKGNRKSFTCPYHAWTYSPNGSLKRVPKDYFPSLNENRESLTELPVECRHGLVWVLACPDGSIDVAAHLGPIDDQLASWSIGEYILERDTVIEEDMNWKYVLDGFLEIYHIPPLHVSSIAPYIHGNYCLYDRFGRHSRLVATRKSFDQYRHDPLEKINLLSHIAVNYQIFPNTIIVWQGDHFEIWTSFPGSRPDQCMVRIQSLTTKEMAADEFKSRWNKNWKVLIDTVVEEDWAISKRIQRNIPYNHQGMVHFGRNEPGMQHFHSQLDEAVKSI